MSAIVWMDMEMTGLDPDKDRVLEVAALVTDGDLDVIAEGPHLVVYQPPEVLSAMDDWNTTHHTQSGLIRRVQESEVTEGDVSRALLDFLAAHTEKKRAPLAGNSIHQDRRFLARYLPEVEDWLHYRNVDVSTVKELARRWYVEDWLHYRNVDVSTVKELARRWYPKEYSGRPNKKGAHRAMDDILESIAELKYYREAVFLPVS